ncbi:hypothetical protein HDK64DRAFT_264896 [Phyllosticta capitalensis]
MVSFLLLSSSVPFCWFPFYCCLSLAGRCFCCCHGCRMTLRLLDQSQKPHNLHSSPQNPKKKKKERKKHKEKRQPSAGHALFLFVRLISF